MFTGQKTRITGLPSIEKSLTISVTISTEYQHVTHRQTDERIPVVKTHISYADVDNNVHVHRIEICEA